MSDYECISECFVSQCDIESLYWEYKAMDEHEMLQFHLYQEATGYDAKYAMEHYEDCRYFTYEDRWHEFYELYPDAEKAEQYCDYIRIDIDAWLDSFSRVEWNNEIYFVETY